MSRLRNVRLGDERGQALVLVVLIVAGLAFIVQVVTDGGWLLGAQRKTQAVADASALAAVQELPGGNPQAVAVDYANRNLGAETADDIDVRTDRDDSTVEVTIRRQVDGIFGMLTGDFDVTAEARAGAPVTLDNNELQSLPVEASHVAPLAIRADVCGEPPWGSSCFGRSVRLMLFRAPEGGGGGDDDDDDDDDGDEDRGLRRLSTFGIVDLPCATSSGCTDPAAWEVANWIDCSGCVSGEINLFRDLETVDFDELECGGGGSSGCQIRDAINRVRGQTLIVPVYESFDGDTFEGIEGFAAFVVTRVGPWNRVIKRIEGRITTFTASDSSRIDPDANNLNFGVRAFGLIR